MQNSTYFSRSSLHTLPGASDAQCSPPFPTSLPISLSLFLPPFTASCFVSVLESIPCSVCFLLEPTLSFRCAVSKIYHAWVAARYVAQVTIRHYRNTGDGNCPKDPTYHIMIFIKLSFFLFSDNPFL